VCATNESMYCQKDGVDGVLAAVAGPQLLADIQAFPVIFNTDWGSIRCLTGDAIIAGPRQYGALDANFVIFAVGPQYYNATNDDLKRLDPYLRSAYRSSLDRAKETRLEVVIFSLICCGNRGGRHLRHNLKMGFETVCEFSGYPELQEVHLYAYKPEEAEGLMQVAQGYELKLMKL